MPLLGRALTRAIASVPIQPLPDDSIGFFGLLPEKAMAAAFNDFVLGAFDIVAQMLGGHNVIAGIGVDFVLTADQAQRRSGDLLQVLAGLVPVARDDML